MKQIHVALTGLCLVGSLGYAQMPFREDRVGRYHGRERYQLQEKTTTGRLDAKEVLHERLRGILITTEDRLPHDYVLRATEGVFFYRSMDNEIGAAAEKQLRKELTKRFIGKPLTYELVEQIKARVEKVYRTYGKKMTSVNMPGQTLSEGVLTISAFESKLGKVTVKGNKWFDASTFEQRLSLKESEVIDSHIVLSDLSSMNRNPFHQVDAVYRSGSNHGTTDIELSVVDENPLQAYAGCDSYGYLVTGAVRSFAGCSWGNVLGLDQILAFQYMGSLNPQRFQSYELSYKAPISEKGELSFGGEYAIFSLSSNKSRGESFSVAGQYAFSFEPRYRAMQEVGFGFDYKATNNDLIVGLNTISSQFVTLLALTGRYELCSQGESQQIMGHFSGVLQPFAFGESMSQAAYWALQPGCERRYFLAKIAAQHTWEIFPSSLSSILKVRGQVSSGPLFPWIQQSLGGIESVRGYPTGVLLVDDACIGNWQLRLPKIDLNKSLGLKKSPQSFLQGSLCVDIAGGWNALGEKTSSYFLAGAGPSASYQMSPWFEAKIDLGIRVAKFEEKIGRTALYFSAMGHF